MEHDFSQYREKDSNSTYKIFRKVNPFYAFNELVLGERVPKISLQKIKSKYDEPEQTLVPCPHCGKVHSGLKWDAFNNLFRNWYGLYCDNCGKIIPCVRNYTAWLLLAVTFPLWGWFAKSMKAAWLNKQASRYKNLDLERVPYNWEGKRWILMGYYFAVMLLILNLLINPLLFGEVLSAKKVLISIVVAAIGGLTYGYFMKRWMPYVKHSGKLGTTNRG